VVSANLSFDIANRLSENNYVVVISPKPTRPLGMKFSQMRNEINFEHIILDSYTFPKSELVGRMKESYSFGKETSKFIEANKSRIKVIYANTWPLFAQFFLVKTAKKYNIPVVLHVQDVYPDSITKKINGIAGKALFSALLPLDKYILKNSRKVIGISQDMIDYLKSSRKIKEDKFVFIRNWQNDEVFMQEFDANTNKDFVFMFLGSISASAGVEVLIQAFHKAAIENSKLVIAGSGTDKEKCMQLAKQLKNGNVVFCEARQDEVSRLQSQANVLLLPLKKGISLTATPSKLTAYMFSAKPVLACVEKESDTAKIIDGCKGGLISEPENIEQLAATMQQISKLSQVALKEMGYNSRLFAEEHLSKKVNLEKLAVVIESIK
jgi:glycosyltransferase involved in cell wall biosynthesis